MPRALVQAAISGDKRARRWHASELECVAMHSLFRLPCCESSEIPASDPRLVLQQVPNVRACLKHAAFMLTKGLAIAL